VRGTAVDDYNGHSELRGRADHFSENHGTIGAVSSGAVDGVAAEVMRLRQSSQPPAAVTGEVPGVGFVRADGEVRKTSGRDGMELRVDRHATVE
jgi:hypothetical protein